MQNLNEIIEESFEHKEKLTSTNTHPKLTEYVLKVIDDLTTGKLRVAEKINGTWIVNTWVKKAVLLYFTLTNSKIINGATSNFYDKVPLQFTDTTEAEFKARQIRLVPTACVRHGAYIGKKTVLMPSYVNIGAHVGDNTMIDTWATVGSCAQIGNNVHISGGAGIGGVLEPIQAQPTIIEDNCFIGARSEIVEGAIVEEGSVISMGVFIGQSTKIYDRNKDEISYGRIPAGSVVVPGSLPAKNGKYNLNCAVIIKTVDAKTKAKVSINQLLRD